MVQTVPDILTRLASKLSIQGRDVHCVREFLDNA